jgi:pectate lyase
MKKKTMSLFVSCMLLLSSTPVLGKGHDDGGRNKGDDQTGRAVLGQNDGWASFSTGTTGGSAADQAHIFTVKNRTELIQALGGDNATNRNINTDDNGNPLGAQDYKDPAFDFGQYLNTYSPDVWGKKTVTGPLEEARKRSATNQKNRVVINVGSNTTLIGTGKNAKIKGGAFSVKGVDNIIIRNIEFVAPIDFFPSWDPLDGAEGNWNSEYDGLTIDGATHVWVNQNTFGDGDFPDSKSGSYFGREFMQHDGLLDIKSGSDYVTVSYNLLQDHDKVTLVGSSDSSKVDDGHLKVTFHHNHFKNLSQRLPRVRFGQVHIYNNYYEFDQASEYKFGYAIGVGVNSKAYAENNYFDFDYEQDISKIIGYYKGTSIYETGSLVKTPSGMEKDVDLVAAFNAANTIQLNENVGWTPALHDKISPAASVKGQVKGKAGAGKLKSDNQDEDDSEHENENEHEDD